MELISCVVSATCYAHFGSTYLRPMPDWIQKKICRFPSVLTLSSEFMEKTSQAAQLAYERFMTINHSRKIFFYICQTELPPTSSV